MGNSHCDHAFRGVALLASARDAGVLIIGRYTPIIIGTSFLAQRRAAPRASRGLSGYSIACARVAREFKVMHIYRFVSRRKETKEAAKTLVAPPSSAPSPRIPAAPRCLFSFLRSVAGADSVAECARRNQMTHLPGISVLGSSASLSVPSTRSARVGSHPRLRLSRA